MKLCSECLISLSYKLSYQLSKVTYNSVCNTSKNFILFKILENKSKLTQNNKFIILVDGNRYGIEILSATHKLVCLKQYFLHYNGNQLIPITVRYVQIVI